MKHQVDLKDLEYVMKRGYKPIGWMPGIRGAKNQPMFNETRFVLGDGQFVSVFHVKPIYYETPTGHWRPMDEICTKHGNKRIHLKPDAMRIMSSRYLQWLMKRQALFEKQGELLFDYGGVLSGGLQPQHMMFAATLTAYPDPDPETTTCDGTPFETTSTASWATLIGDTGDSTFGDGAGLSMRLWALWMHASIYEDNARMATLFDTSSLGAGASISAAILSPYVFDKNDPGSKSWNVDVYTCNPASNTGIVGADYSTFGSTSQTGSATAYVSITTSNYHDFTLDATGRGNVAKTGVSKFGTRNQNYDVAGSAPGTTGGSWDTYSRVYSAETAGTANDPKLVITYTASSQNSGFFALF